MPSAPGKITYAVNGGFYKDQGGVGVGFGYRLDTLNPIMITGSYGNGGGDAHVGRVGIAGEF